MRGWLAIAALIVAADQISKHLAAAWLQLQEPVAVLPFVNLTLAHNTGAAFSFLADGAGWQRWFFVALALAVSGVIADGTALSGKPIPDPATAASIASRSLMPRP